MVIQCILKLCKCIQFESESSDNDDNITCVAMNLAGIINAPYERSDDGFECHFQINYLSQFLLTNHLLERMKYTSKAKDLPCQIINVSSVAHFCSKLDFMELEKRYTREIITHGAQSSLLNQCVRLKITLSIFVCCVIMLQQNIQRYEVLL